MIVAHAPRRRIISRLMGTKSDNPMRECLEARIADNEPFRRFLADVISEACAAEARGVLLKELNIGPRLNRLH